MHKRSILNPSTVFQVQRAQWEFYFSQNKEWIQSTDARTTEEGQKHCYVVKDGGRCWKME
jgi:hypothetical protein